MGGGRSMSAGDGLQDVVTLCKGYHVDIMRCNELTDYLQAIGKFINLFFIIIFIVLNVYFVYNYNCNLHILISN